MIHHRANGSHDHLTIVRWSIVFDEKKALSDMLAMKCEDWLFFGGTDVSSLGHTRLCLIPSESVDSAVSIDRIKFYFYF